MSSYFWNSGPNPPPTPGGGGTGGGGGGFHPPGWNPDGGHWGGGGPVPGGAVPPTLNAAGQALLSQITGGPNFRINTAGLGPLWQQLGMTAAPAGAGAYGAGAGAGYTAGVSHPIQNVTGGGGMNSGPNPPGGPHMYPGGNPGGPPVAGGPTPNPPTQDGPFPNPALLNAYWQYIQNRWPGGWNNGPPGPFRQGL